MQRSPRAVPVCLVLGLGACTCDRTGAESSPAPARPATATATAFVAPSSASAPSPASAAPPAELGSVALPVRYPDQPPPSQKRVLAPLAHRLAAAVAQGAETQALALFPAQLAERGTKSSRLLRTGRAELLPNALIVELGARAAEAGDPVWFALDGRARRGVVRAVDGRSVLVLPFAGDDEVVRVGVDSIVPVRVAGAVGSTAACAVSETQRPVTVLHRADGRLLGLTFAGQLVAAPDADCELLDPNPRVAPAVAVRVPRDNAWVGATVVSAARGRVTVKLKAGATEHTPAMDVWSVSSE